MLDFQSKVIYQIYPKSFYDSNGNGIGDLKGITLKLDYLKDLGVDYLWLTPFFQSPQRDNGYDVSDYRSVDSAFGSMEDVENLLREADRRGIGLILDMVFNHTSTAHAWFRRALEGDPKYQDYYIFRDGDPHHPPTNWQSKFGGSAWEYLPSLKKWYLHLFDVTQADLNWSNPSVREELKDVIRFWKSKGVKGFRFDVVNLISKPAHFADDTQGDGRRFYTDRPMVHEYLQELVRDTGLDENITVGEMSSTSLEHCVRYSNPNSKELSMVFSFHHLKIDYKNGDKWQLMSPDLASLGNLLRTWQEGMQAGNGWNALFWCNHDQPRIVSRLGSDGAYWKESAKMLALCLHMMRGTPYIFQGEELGMTNAGYSSIDQYRDVESLNYYHILRASGISEPEVLQVLQARSRDNGRTPMQWSAEKNAGFTSGTPWIGLPEKRVEANVQDETKDPQSILSFYKRLIRLRKKHAIIGSGSIRFPFPEQEGIIAYVRQMDEERLIVTCNLTSTPRTLPVHASYASGTCLADSYESAPAFTNGQLLLRPYEGCALLCREGGCV